MVKKATKSSKRDLALVHINGLFNEAKLVFSKDHTLSDDYVKKALVIRNKFKVKLPSEIKKSYCKNCHSYLVPGKNLRIRAINGKMAYYCLICKTYMRFPYIKEKKSLKNSLF